MGLGLGLGLGSGSGSGLARSSSIVQALFLMFWSRWLCLIRVRVRVRASVRGRVGVRVRVRVRVRISVRGRVGVDVLVAVVVPALAALLAGAAGALLRDELPRARAVHRDEPPDRVVLALQPRSSLRRGARVVRCERMRRQRMRMCWCERRRSGKRRGRRR